jgi:hypothetical protein
MSSKLASTPLGSKNFPGLKGAGFNLKLGSLRTVADSERALATAGLADVAFLRGFVADFNAELRQALATAK